LVLSSADGGRYPRLHWCGRGPDLPVVDLPVASALEVAKRVSVRSEASDDSSIWTLKSGIGVDATWSGGA